MYEEDMLKLREQRESAERALHTNITDEQRTRLERVINAIDGELKRADSLIRSELLRDLPMMSEEVK